ncbi:Uncharacterised protein [Shigella sonnei]|nr:Uncharacterised protein [Shigella sonnei]
MQSDNGIESCAFVGLQGFPVGNGVVEIFAFRRMQTAFDIVKGGFVRCNQTGFCAHFDCHIAQGHTTFHA